VRLLSRQFRGGLGWCWLALVLLFVYAPIIVVIGASFDPGAYVMKRAFLQFPPKGFTFHWYFSIPAPLWASLKVSVLLALAVAVGAVIVGMPAALGLVRGRYPGRNLVAALFRAPLQIPFIVIGIALLEAFQAVDGVLGTQLRASLIGLFLAHLLVGTPYVISAAGTALTQLSPRLDEAALSLGATRWRAFRRVTLPLIMPGVLAGAMFAFLVSFTDVTIAVFLAPDDLTTFPVWVYSSIQNDLESTLPAVSTLAFLGALAAILLLQKLTVLETVLRGGGAKG
jgi:putative spermidine/putrescine transport system permease protein